MSDAAALRAEFWALPDTALVDRPTAAAAVYLSPTSLEAMAIKGGGPSYRRQGRRALYVKADVVAWATQRDKVSNTAELVQA